MNNTEASVLEFVQKEDVRFVKLTFCDIFGHMENISISSKELERAFRDGISFDASAIRGFLYSDQSDLLLEPDPSTISIMPWRPSQGRAVRMFCDIKNPDGSRFAGDSRSLLKDAEAQAQKLGYPLSIGPECEFYLFKRDEDGKPTRIPLDEGSYFEAAPFDKGENIRRDICLTLEQMGFYTERSHHESGPGQNEVDFRFAGAVESADNTLLFKNVVRILAERSGLFASFLPKPLSGESGSGLHINISLKQPDEYVHLMMIGGILSHIEEIAVFSNPLVNSYERLGEDEAPIHIGWGRSNRDLLVRIPAAEGPYRRFELRSPDPSCNPYLVFTLLIKAAMEGIQARLKPQSDWGRDLPSNLGDAIKIAKQSNFLKQTLPAEMLSVYLDAKESEWAAWKTDHESRSFRFERN